MPIPDVIDDEVTRACTKLRLEPRFIFDKLAEGFTNSIEVATAWQKRWLQQGYSSLPAYAKQKLSEINRAN